MSVGSKIAQRRKELGLTQGELAHLMGYKSKAAISKIETGVNDITQSTVVKFAEVLDTSVAYLMEWDENISDDSPQVRMIARAGKKMSEADREKMLQLIKVAFPDKFDD